MGYDPKHWQTLWEKYGVNKPRPRIVSAANIHRELRFIIAGPRHWDNIMHGQLAMINAGKRIYRSTEFDQGFIDQFGDYYSRTDALEVVKKSGQPFNEERNGSDTKLFSEGLY